MTTTEMITKASDHFPGIIVSAGDNSRGDQFRFRYNDINIKDGTVNFGQRNAFQQVSFKPDDIENITESNDSTIDIFLKNGEKFVLCLGEYNPPSNNAPTTEMDIEDFIFNLKRSTSASVSFSEQAVELCFKFEKISVHDTDDDMDWDGDREITVSLSSSDGENHFDFTIDEYETRIKVLKNEENLSVVFLDIPEMAFSKIMLVMNYVEISMMLPVGTLGNLES